MLIKLTISNRALSVQAYRHGACCLWCVSLGAPVSWCQSAPQQTCPHSGHAAGLGTSMRRQRLQMVFLSKHGPHTYSQLHSWNPHTLLSTQAHACDIIRPRPTHLSMAVKQRPMSTLCAPSPTSAQACTWTLHNPPAAKLQPTHMHTPSDPPTCL